MKRVIGLAIVTAGCIIALMSVRGTLPFVPVSGSSMEPALHPGGLLMIEPVNPENIKIGDIIVYNIPRAVRDYYNYPLAVSHRVIEIQTEPSLTFQTGGDSTGKDPFTVRPMNIRGVAGNQIPYLGLPFLIFQSQYSVIFVIIALVLLALFLYSREINRVGNRVHRRIFSPVLDEEKRANRELSRKIEAAERKMDTTEQALLQFSAAIADYSRHLASHTSAIQGLSQASHELKKGAAEQNRVLSAIMDNMVKSSHKRELQSSSKRIPAATQQSMPAAEKPTGLKIPPYHRALYKAIPVKPVYKIATPTTSTEKQKRTFENPVSRAEPIGPKNERFIIVTKKPKINTDRPAPAPVQPEPEIKRVVPLADKLAIDARKSTQPAEEKPSWTEKLHPHHPTDVPIPPGCARDRQEDQEELWR